MLANSSELFTGLSDLYLTILFAIICPSFSSPKIFIIFAKFLLSNVFTTSYAEYLLIPICILSEPLDLKEKPL